MLKDFFEWFKHLRFLQLTLFFLFVLLSLPLRTDHPYFNVAAQLLLLNAMVVTLSACGSKSLLRWLLLAIWAIAEALYLRVVLILGPAAHHLDVAITAIFFLLVMVVCVAAILPYIFQKRQVSVDTIFAAVVAYFFISFIFANLYTLIYFINPLSFNLPPTPSPNQFYAVFTQMLYFSLITIVGVGYGDILPLLPFPRMVAAVQGVLGHFYVAVLVAWLVGTFISQSIQLSQKQEERTLERLLE
jgi:voltage-gated potassium channel